MCVVAMERKKKINTRRKNNGGVPFKVLSELACLTYFLVLGKERNRFRNPKSIAPKHYIELG